MPHTLSQRTQNRIGFLQLPFAGVLASSLKCFAGLPRVNRLTHSGRKGWIPQPASCQQLACVLSSNRGAMQRSSGKLAIPWHNFANRRLVPAFDSDDYSVAGRRHGPGGSARSGVLDSSPRITASPRSDYRKRRAKVNAKPIAPR
jgi:hypothetical protein